MTLLAMSATHDALKSDEKVKMLMPIHNFSPNMYAYQICGLEIGPYSTKKTWSSRTQ